MSWTFTRRAAFAMAAGSAVSTAFAADSPETAAPGPFRIGICSYSLREFSRALAIKMIAKLGVSEISVKDTHLPYNLSAADLKKALAEFQKAGLKIVSAGNTTLSSEEPGALRKYFEYARACRIPMLIAAPSHATLPEVEKLAKEFQIAVAIHTHGPEDKHFPSPQVVLEAVKSMDPLMGLCMDVGHSMRTGADVVQEITNAGPRLLDLHFKDLKNGKEKDSQCDVGEGVMPVVAIFKQLNKVGYRGSVNLEYEINSDDPVPGMLHSLGYMKGVAAGLAG
jgi:sugar phosphate isomerase/epimerase